MGEPTWFSIQAQRELLLLLLLPPRVSERAALLHSAVEPLAVHTNCGVHWSLSHNTDTFRPKIPATTLVAKIQKVYYLSSWTFYSNSEARFGLLSCFYPL
jgi:hypothetical protein